MIHVSRDIEKLAKYKGICFEAKNRNLVSFTAISPIVLSYLQNITTWLPQFFVRALEAKINAEKNVMLAYTAAQILPASGQ